MEKQENKGKIVGALLIGAAAGGVIGVILGLLLAPAKGSETRKRLFAKGDKLSATAKEKFTGFIDELKKEVVSGKAQSTELVDNAGTKIVRSK